MSTEYFEKLIVKIKEADQHIGLLTKEKNDLLESVNKEIFDNAHVYIDKTIQGFRLISSLRVYDERRYGSFLNYLDSVKSLRFNLGRFTGMSDYIKNNAKQGDLIINDEYNRPGNSVNGILRCRTPELVNGTCNNPFIGVPKEFRHINDVWIDTHYKNWGAIPELLRRMTMHDFSFNGNVFYLN